MSWKFTFWTNLGVYQVPTQFPFGSAAFYFKKKAHFIDVLIKQAEETKNLPYYGFYFMHSPMLIVTDVDMVRNITVKDFDSFVNRGSSGVMKIFKSGTRTDMIWRQQLTSLENEEWKNLRSTFSPIFTAGKMKAMMIFMQETCNQLTKHLDGFADSKEDFEIKKSLGKYSMATIASAAFGVDAECFTNEKSKFVEYAISIFRPQSLKMMIAMLPFGINIFKALNISVMKETETDFFYNAILSSINHRRTSKTRRNDLIDLMLDAIKGDLEEDHAKDTDHFDEAANLNHHHSKKTYDEMVVVSTALVLLVAGYDTTGTTLAYACYALSKNIEVQEKLREEVEEVTNGDAEKEITYDDLQNMTYLDQVLCETLRFYNPAGLLKRATSKEYKIPGHDLTIPKDVNIWISSPAIHFDPKHYETPHSFNPDHFTKEAKASRHP